MQKNKARTPGRGSVYQRKSDGRWVGALPVGRGTRAGRDRKYLYASSPEEAERRLGDALRALEQGLAIPDPRWTVGNQLQAWLEWQRTQVRPATWTTYATHVQVHTRPLHGIPLMRLTVADVRKWVIRLRAAREPLSNTTIGHSLTVLRMALRQAVGDGLITRNVAEFVEKPPTEKTAARVLTIAQIKRYFASIEGDRLEALWVTAFATGLRQSELLGLRWQDVDLDAGVVIVAGSLRPVPVGFRPEGDARRLVRTDRGKTDNAKRAAPLPPFAVKRLRAWQDRQKVEPANVDGLVFTSGRGTPLDGRNTTRTFKRSLAAASVPAIRFHDARHSTASVYRAMGLSIDDVKSILGHGSEAQTWDYTHVLPEVWAAATAAMERALG